MINRSIDEAREAFQRFGIRLPSLGSLTAQEWAQRGPEWDEVRDCMLGWDVTDFGSGRFADIGRTLFTLRNGSMKRPGYLKSYAQKYLYDPDGQRAPAHFHLNKMEDICCLGGGGILVQLRSANQDGTPSDQALRVSVDGVSRTIAAGETIRLVPGMSVCIPPRTIHQFWGEGGITVSAEVSSVCDDWNDNVFLEPAERFPRIEEDAPRSYYLCHEYPPAP